MADVRQVLGYYQTGPTPWFELIDLEDTLFSPDQDDVQSLPSSLPSEFGEEAISRPDSRASYAPSTLDGPIEYERINQSLRMPSLSLDLPDCDYAQSTKADSYVHGVEDFLHQMDASRRPTFV